MSFALYIRTIYKKKTKKLFRQTCDLFEWKWMHSRRVRVRFWRSIFKSHWKVQKCIFPLNIEFVGVQTKESMWKIKSEMLCSTGIQCICGAMAQWTVEPYLLTYLSVKEVFRSLPPASLSKRYFSPIDSIEEAQLTDYQVNKFKEKAFGGESNCHKWRGVLEALTNTVWWWPGKLQSERTICWHRLFWLEVITRFRC